MAWMSAAGLWAYDNTLFDDMAIPDGVDRDVLVFNILAETAELEILYPDYDWFKRILEQWSKKELPVWERLYATTKLEYNPIENYDRMEEWVDSNEGDAIGRVAAFNESDLIPSGSSNTKTNGTHKGRTHGNVGVTTSQQMIEAERNVSEFNIIDYIVQSFKRRFCIMVY